ncbi:MAG: hypothetical protein M0033_11695 [Nitrospiraceae bacterium]|nr:hypothetical protein [Nitrospiraceae bacterium]
MAGWYFARYIPSWQWGFIYSESPPLEETLDQHEWNHDYVSRTLVGFVLMRLNSLALLYDLAQGLAIRDLWTEPLPAINGLESKYINPDQGSCQYLEGVTLLLTRAAAVIDLARLEQLKSAMLEARRSKGMGLSDLDRIPISTEIVQAFIEAAEWSKKETEGDLQTDHAVGVTMLDKLLQAHKGKVDITDFALAELRFLPKTQLINGSSGRILLFDVPDYRFLVQSLIDDRGLVQQLTSNKKSLFNEHRDLWYGEMSQALNMLDFTRFPQAAFPYVYCVYSATRLLVSDFYDYMKEHIHDNIRQSPSSLTDKTGPLMHYLNDGMFARELPKSTRSYIEVLKEARPLVQGLFPEIISEGMDKDMELKAIRRCILIVNGFVHSFLEDVHHGYCNNSIFEFRCPYLKISQIIRRYAPDDNAFEGLLNFATSLCSKICKLQAADCTFTCSKDTDTFDLAKLRRRSFFHEMLFNLLIRENLRSLF